jgi:hypothetical protein
MICFLDLDGVLVDFVAGVLKHYGLPADTPWPTYHHDHVLCERLGLSRDDFWSPCGEAFWSELSWTAEGRELLHTSEACFGPDNVYLLSHPCPTYGCLEGKKRWVDQHLPDYRGRLFLGAAKHAFAAATKVLIDDSDDNVARFRAAGGHAVLVPRPWNQKCGHDTVEYVKRSVDSRPDRVRARTQAAARKRVSVRHSGTGVSGVVTNRKRKRPTKVNVTG